MRFKVSSSPAGSGAAFAVALSGDIGAGIHEALEELLNAVAGKRVTLDCKDIRHINSPGVREWMMFMREAARAGTTPEFVACPAAMVDFCNLVGGFLGDPPRVTSFYVPYRCNDCGKKSDHLFLSAQLHSTMTEFPELGCATCDGKRQPEVRADDFAIALLKDG